MLTYNLCYNKPDKSLKHINTVITSANTTVPQIPFMPNMYGSINIPTTINTIPLLVAIIIEDFASSIAVKYEDISIFNPLNKNANP